MSELDLVLPAAYRAFNARDIEAALRLMHRGWTAEGLGRAGE